MLARMKSNIVLFSFALLSASACAQSADSLQQTLLAKVNDFHLSHQHVDQDLLFKTISSSLLYIAHTGRYTLDEMFSPGSAQVSCVLGSFKVTEPQMRTLGTDAAVLTYHLHQQATCNDKPEPPDLIATDALTRVNGEWLILVHTETPLH